MFIERILIMSNKDTKEFKLNSEKLDVNILKTEEGTVVTVEAKNTLLKKVGELAVKGIIKKFSK